jgi:high-affinity iron transporter
LFVLATLVIGLREGLEAALIVGIIAAFLRKNGASMRPMWLGVALAVALSIAVGVGLDLVEQSLPQAGQEAMESVIGAVAIFFVTTMIVWMSAHARGLKRELEAEAAAALSRGGAYALAVMAFLAVLKEGFETSVFLLATFSAAQSAVTAGAGAVIGVLIAVGIGWGIYVGGVRLNLARFFRVTGAFLILVAAGLTVTALRTAHEAGWLNGGQQPTVDLSWLVAPGTVQSALITGVLGVPADPRLIEVVGWFAYLIPVGLYVYWPPPHRLRGRAQARFQLVIAAVLAVAAVGLAVALPSPRPDVPSTAAVVTAADPAAPVIGTARLTSSALELSGADPLPLRDGQARSEQHGGLDATAWTVVDDAPPAAAPSTIDLAQLVTLSGGRLPVGLNPQQHRGPFAAQWSIQRSTTVWAADGVLLDAVRQTTAVVTVSGGGLQTRRTVTVGDPGAVTGRRDWQISGAYRDQVAAALQRADADRAEHNLWGIAVPIALGVAALSLAVAALRHRRPPRDPPRPVPASTLTATPADLP